MSVTPCPESDPMPFAYPSNVKIAPIVKNEKFRSIFDKTT